LPKANWVNVSEKFTKQIGDDDLKPSFLCRCQGLLVTPTGELIMQTAEKGICISKDQGANWSVVPNNNIKGRCETDFGFSLPYPYDGRLAFFCYDGTGGQSGGISLDHGDTWRPFSQLIRGVEFADVDWNTHDPRTIFGMTHEPFYTVLSTDGGKSWKQLNKDTETGGVELYNQLRLGVVDDHTFVRYNSKQGGIEYSSDAGKNWTLVANYRVNARRPVHYGKDLYWTTTKGVITTADGKSWKITGKGAAGAFYGPYFGNTEKEFVILTPESFLKTEDGGKTWTKLADYFVPPDIFHGNSAYSYYGWDAKHNLLYASGLGAAVYQLAP
jgi:hypothetical protein